MLRFIQNTWEMTKGVRLQLGLALVLLIIVGIVIASFIFQPDPTTELSQNERSYPQATPQPFRNQEEKDTGTLVVTSNVEKVTVLLDASDHPDPEDPIKRGQKWPHNTTPFTVASMPVGKHVLIGRKPPLYDSATVAFEIKKDQVTRVQIELIPLRLGN